MGNRVLLGNRSTGGYGLYISKSTSDDVLDCDLNDLTFNSNLSDSTSGIVDNKGAMYAPYANGVVTRVSSAFMGVTTWPTSDFTYEDSSGNDIVTIPLILLTLKVSSTTQTDSWQYNSDHLPMTGCAAYIYAGGHNSLGLTSGGGPYNRGTVWSWSGAGDVHYVILKQMLNF
jgi:hypothetical protein